MNYYPHHIGDFNNATRHLTRIERSIYRDLLELYYDTEQPLTLDQKSLCRKIIARSDEEVTGVQQVLNEFFTETEQGWYHERCEKEIFKYHGNIESKSAAGRASAAKRAAKTADPHHMSGDCSTDVEQVLNDRSTNQEPRTINQEPLKPKSKDLARGTRLPKDWFLPKEWGEWALKENPALTPESIRKMAEQFKDYWIAVSGHKGVKLDWCATWRNWIRKSGGLPQAGAAKFDGLAYVMQFAKNGGERDEKVIEH